MHDMLCQFGVEFKILDTVQTFTFGDGVRKASMGSVQGDLFLGDGPQK